MDMLLVAITLASLAVAIAMSVWTRTLVRHEQRRSEARVTMLQRELAGAAVQEAHTVQASLPAPEDMLDTLTERDHPERLGRAESSEAPPPREALVLEDAPWRTPQHAGLFAGASPTGGDLPRFATTLVLGGLLLGGLAAAGLLFGSAGDARSETRVTGQANHPPLELTSLRHERNGTTWSIVGLVRNPPEGDPLNTITAVGFLFDQHGAFLSSGRALLEFSTLSPATESPFAISITTGDRVARYRVGFRTSDGNVIRHIDLRPSRAVDTSEEPAAP